MPKISAEFHAGPLRRDQGVDDAVVITAVTKSVNLTMMSLMRSIDDDVHRR